MIVTRDCPYRKLDPLRSHGSAALGYLGDISAAQPTFTDTETAALFAGAAPATQTQQVIYTRDGSGGLHPSLQFIPVPAQMPAWFLQQRLANNPVGPNGLKNPVQTSTATVPGVGTVWIVPDRWVLGGGMQSLPLATALSLGAVAKPAWWIGTPAYFFKYDPNGYITTGLASGQYRPGQNRGLENWLGALKLAAFAAVIPALPAVGAAFGVQGASVAAEQVALQAATAGATSGLTTAGAGIAAEGAGAGVVAAAGSAVAPVVASASSGASTFSSITGALKTAQSVVGGAKSVYGLYKQYLSQAAAAKARGNLDAAAYYQNQANKAAQQVPAQPQSQVPPIAWAAIAALALSIL